MIREEREGDPQSPALSKWSFLDGLLLLPRRYLFLGIIILSEIVVDQNSEQQPPVSGEHTHAVGETWPCTSRLVVPMFYYRSAFSIQKG